MQHDQKQPLATDYIEAQEYSIRVKLAEFGFKVLFKFFGAVATLLGALSFGKDRSHADHSE